MPQNIFDRINPTGTSATSGNIFDRINPQDTQTVGMGDVRRDEGMTKRPIGATGSWAGGPTEREPIIGNSTGLERVARTITYPSVAIGRGGVDAITGMAKGIGSMVSALREGPQPTPDDPGRGKSEEIAAKFGGPVGFLFQKFIVNPSVDNAINLKRQLATNPQHVEDGRTPEHRINEMSDLLGSVPFAGPMAKGLFDRAVKEKDPLGAVGEGAVYALTPKVVGEVTPKIVKGGKALVNLSTDAMEDLTSPISSRRVYAQDRPFLITSPEGKLFTGLKPDLDNSGIIRGGNVLKKGEELIGKPVKDVPSAKEAAKAAYQDLWQRRRAIIDPQKDVVVTGSRDALIKARVDSIPDVIQGTEREGAIDNILSATQDSDYTIGQLERITSDLNSLNRTYHQAKLSGALTREAQVKGASDVAAESSARELMHQGMTEHGLMGSDIVRFINEHIGSLIKVEDALDAARITAQVEGFEPLLKRTAQRVAPPILRSSGVSSMGVRIGNSAHTVNESIANAMRRWKTRMPEYGVSQPPVTFRRPTLEKGQGELIPSSGLGPLLSGPNATQTSGLTDYQTQLRGQQIWRGATPDQMSEPTPGIKYEGMPQGQLGLFERSPSGGGAMSPPGGPQPVTDVHGTPVGKQGGLFSISQTPMRFNPTARTTYTLQDLHSMLAEIENYNRANPHSPQRAELIKDTVALRHEINRRIAAHKTPKSNP